MPCSMSATSVGPASPSPQTRSPSVRTSKPRSSRCRTKAASAASPSASSNSCPHPWDALAGKFRPGDRVHGTVTRVTDFGAFVELEPGVEGLIHVSEMSWTKKVRAASDILKPGDTVEAVILSINPAERRMSLGLKQALGNPWADLAQKLPVGSSSKAPS